MCCIISGEPVDDPKGRIRNVQTANKFQTDMMNAPCAECPWSCCWCLGQFIPATGGCTQVCFILIEFIDFSSVMITILSVVGTSIQSSGRRFNKIFMLPYVTHSVTFYLNFSNYRGIFRSVLLWSMQVWRNGRAIVSTSLLVHRSLLLQLLRYFCLSYLCSRKV